MGQKLRGPLQNSSLVQSIRKMRVLIADPYPVIVHGLRSIIECDTHLRVVGEARSLPALKQAMAAERPDIALVDWEMASQDLVTTRELLCMTPLLFLTISESSQAKKEMLDLGGCGFVSKWSSARKIQTAVFSKCGGRVRAMTDDAGAEDVIPIASCTDPEQRVARLTARERQLLPLICSGLRNKEIAQNLGIAETTVWHHLTSIFAKLLVNDRVGLVRFAYSHRLVLPQGQAARSERATVGADNIVKDVDPGFCPAETMTSGRQNESRSGSAWPGSSFS
jgi:DNA-binding NarL/FixJ family response regulator